MAESAKWYVAHTYSGYENAVKTAIEKFVANRHLEDMIVDIQIPMETVTEVTDSGEVKVNGYDIFEDAAKAKRAIGYSPELPPVYGDMTPYEYLSFVAKAKDVPRAEIPQHLQEIMEVPYTIAIQQTAVL